MSSIKSGSVAARPLGTKNTEKQRDSFALLLEGVLDSPATRPDPAPSPHKADLAEQRFLDRQSIEAGHVVVRVLAFDVEAIVLRDHADRIALLESRVQ
jgi:hypothetical protein